MLYVRPVFLESAPFWNPNPRSRFLVTPPHGPSHLKCASKSVPVALSKTPKSQISTILLYSQNIQLRVAMKRTLVHLQFILSGSIHGITISSLRNG